jgi:hypothetical protein
MGRSSPPCRCNGSKSCATTQESTPPDEKLDEFWKCEERLGLWRDLRGVQIRPRRRLPHATCDRLPFWHHRQQLPIQGRGRRTLAVRREAKGEGAVVSREHVASFRTCTTHNHKPRHHQASLHSTHTCCCCIEKDKRHAHRPFPRH